MTKKLTFLVFKEKEIQIFKGNSFQDKELERSFMFDDLYKYYVSENHSAKETAKYFNILLSHLTKIMNNYNIKKPKTLSYEWNKKTLKERYGSENYNNFEQHKKTCLEKYGVDNYFKLVDKIKESHIKSFGYEYPAQNPEIGKRITQLHKERYGVQNPEEHKKYLERRRKTCLERYGVPEVMMNPEIAKKCNTMEKAKRCFKTRVEHGTTNTSKPEEDFYTWLCSKFDVSNIEREYVDEERYPWHCDFYLKDKDIFIELNLFFTHGGHPFDSKNSEDTQKLRLWESKAETSTFYKNAIDVWTKLDPKKFERAKINNLRYLVAYSSEDIPKIKEQLNEIYRI